MLSIPKIIHELGELKDIATANYIGTSKAAKMEDREYWHGVANGYANALRMLKEE
jgi:hypothetical protein